MAQGGQIDPEQAAGGGADMTAAYWKSKYEQATADYNDALDKWRAAESRLNSLSASSKAQVIALQQDLADAKLKVLEAEAMYSESLKQEKALQDKISSLEAEQKRLTESLPALLAKGAKKQEPTFMQDLHRLRSKVSPLGHASQSVSAGAGFMWLLAAIAIIGRSE